MRSASLQSGHNEQSAGQEYFSSSLGWQCLRLPLCNIVTSQPSTSSVSLQHPAVLLLNEFCKILLPSLNLPENATICWSFWSQSHSLVYYSAFSTELEISSNLILIKFDYFFSASQTVYLKVAHNPPAFELFRFLWK